MLIRKGEKNSAQFMAGYFLFAVQVNQIIEASYFLLQLFYLAVQ